MRNFLATHGNMTSMENIEQHLLLLKRQLHHSINGVIKRHHVKVPPKNKSFAFTVIKEYTMTQPWRGIFVIVATPFTESYELDEASLRKGVFGGRNGTFMIDEYRRGACGNMPGAATPDLHVDIWSKLEADNEAGARDLFGRALPALMLNGAFGPSALKETLYRRGVFATNKTRTPGHRMDARDMAEFDAQWAMLEPLLRIS